MNPAHAKNLDDLFKFAVLDLFDPSKGLDAVSAICLHRDFHADINAFCNVWIWLSIRATY